MNVKPHGVITHPRQKIAFIALGTALALSLVLIWELPIQLYPILRWIQSLALLVSAGFFSQARLVGFILHPDDYSYGLLPLAGAIKEKPRGWSKFLKISPYNQSIDEELPSIPSIQYERIDGEIVKVPMDDFFKRIEKESRNPQFFTPISTSLASAILCLSALSNPSLGFRLNSESWPIFHLIVASVLIYAIIIIIIEDISPRLCVIWSARLAGSENYRLCGSGHFIGASAGRIAKTSQLAGLFFLIASGFMLLYFSKNLFDTLLWHCFTIIFISAIFACVVTAIAILGSTIWYATADAYIPLYAFMIVVFALSVTSKFGEISPRSYEDHDHEPDYDYNMRYYR